jgi:hypothetical protein
MWRRAIVTMSAATALLLGPAGTHTAHAETAPDDDVPPRLALACARIPNLQTRTASLIDRLAADERTRGSIAWLEARAEQAAEAGRDELAEAVTNRVDVLTAKADLLPLRAERLAELDGLCEELGV